MSREAAEVEAVHWYLFSASFVAAWWSLGSEPEKGDAVRADRLRLLAGLGCNEEEAGRQFDLLEDVFRDYLDGISAPPSGVLSALRSLFSRPE